MFLVLTYRLPQSNIYHAKYTYRLSVSDESALANVESHFIDLNWIHDEWCATNCRFNSWLSKNDFSRAIFSSKKFIIVRTHRPMFVYVCVRLHVRARVYSVTRYHIFFLKNSAKFLPKRLHCVIEYLFWWTHKNAVKFLEIKLLFVN